MVRRGPKYSEVMLFILRDCGFRSSDTGFNINLWTSMTSFDKCFFFQIGKTGFQLLKYLDFPQSARGTLFAVDFTDIGHGSLRIFPWQYASTTKRQWMDRRLRRGSADRVTGRIHGDDLTDFVTLHIIKYTLNILWINFMFLILDSDWFRLKKDSQLQMIHPGGSTTPSCCVRRSPAGDRWVRP